MSDKSKPNRGLGRGLSALMSDIEPAQGTIEPSKNTAPIEKIRPNPEQPRRIFDKDDLEELSRSIKEKGVIQPLVVRADPLDGSFFQIVAGERRWRAAQLAQLHTLPIVVREFNDQEVLEIAIIENIQRTNLNPLEEALSFRQLMEKFGHTQEQVSSALGKSRSYIANLIRLLNLPIDVQAMVQEGKLSAGHARALITAENPSVLAKQVVAKGLSVRDTERLAKTATQGSNGDKAKVPSNTKDADTRALEGDLSAAVGLPVFLEHSTKGEGGVLKISYKNLNQLDDLCGLLTKG